LTELTSFAFYFVRFTQRVTLPNSAPLKNAASTYELIDLAEGQLPRATFLGIRFERLHGKSTYTIDSEDFCALEAHFGSSTSWPQSTEEYGSRHHHSHPVQLLARHTLFDALPLPLRMTKASGNDEPARHCLACYRQEKKWVASKPSTLLSCS
jgi:hypothetical protein